MFTRKSLISGLIALIFGLLAAAGLQAQDADKKVICFVGHKTSHGFGAHEYNAGNHLIGEWLEKAYPNQIEARYSINWPANEAEFFDEADAVVMFCSGGGGHLVNNHVENFDKVMRTGAGLACLHYGVEVPIGPSGKGMLNWMGGYFEAHWSVNPHWIAEFESFTDHPASNGIKPFKIDDEWYFHMRFRGDMEGITPILSAKAPEETMKRKDGAHSGNPDVRKAVAAGEPQHVAWTYQRKADYNDGRGFGFTGLHYHWNWEDDSFRKTVLNGVAWIAKLPIPKDGVESKRPTKEELEANALEHGGAQNRKPKSAAAEPFKPGAKSGVKPLFSSKVINESTPGHEVKIDVDLKGSKELYLVVSDVDGYAFDWVNWVEPKVVMEDGKILKLTEMKWKQATVGWGQPHIGKNAGGQPMRVLGKPVEDGIGVHASSVLVYSLPKGAAKFQARGALDNGGTDQSGETSVQFHVFNANPGPIIAGSGGGGGGGQAGHEPEDALASLKIHEDLKAQLFASEPLMLSPSAIDVDHRGRVWVCEVINYRRHKGKRPEGDRILIIEDKDGDGKADDAKVFYQGTDVDSAHGICVLGDRVIISAGEEVFSLYDRDGDGKADEGSKEMMFTKISGAQHDHGIHAFHFGPDGRLYFNFGNAGKALHDAEGKIIVDKAGNEVRAGSASYREGMVFRCELDGSGVETLGWNFRNNWEIAVDSFGTIWQSDNDDDGNKGVRINYVMEFGNYGYKDEITGAGWRDPRPNIETEVPLMHWHLNDPGVVPNLIQTGQGSPTGICVYEGHLLPDIFHGQPIHCDAGPNVVRAYVSEPIGGGYQAEMHNILENTTDRWFRPSDVCVAPDGSLIVADWYDPGVGGHAMGDLDRGRLFRVTVEGKEKYSAGEVSLSSPNEAARYLAWQGLHAKGAAAKPELEEMFSQGDPHHRARALWLLARLDYPEAALKDDDPNIRITALRAVRQLHPEQLLAAVESLVGDADAGVRRECSLALRFDGSAKANDLWAKLVAKHDGEDRWALEAIGIGADLHWDARLSVAEKVPTDVLWRARPTGGSPIAAALIAGELPADFGDSKALRSLQFLPDKEAVAEDYAKLFQKIDSPEIALFAAGQLGSNKIKLIEGGEARLNAIIEPMRGKPEFVSLVERLNLRGFGLELVAFISANPNSSEAATAARLLTRDRGYLEGVLRDAENAERAGHVANALGRSGDRGAAGLLINELKRKETSPELARIVVSALANSGAGGRELVKLAEQGQLADDLHFLAAGAIARSPDQGLRNAAKGKFKVPAAAGAEKLPPVAELVAMKGSAEAGKPLYTTTACITCHKVKGEGIDFGPDLSEIGNKLSKEAML
ncbi:MAG: putative membrane-bound dehydrogenase-like protein, partial [Verrucomicrobiales bacterium]